MEWDREIDFIRKLMDKYGIQTLRFLPGAPPQIDLGLRGSVHMLDLNASVFREMKPRTMYSVEDRLQCKYNALLLPDCGEVLLIGPYLTSDISEQIMGTIIEKNGLPVSVLPTLRHYYASLTVLSLNETLLLGIMDVLAGMLWGDDSYKAVYIEAGQVPGAFDSLEGEQLNKTVSAAELRLMEERYAFENQLMHAVSNGMTHQAQMIISRIGEHVLEPRTMDALRNIKNYGVVCNTLLRKAVEQGGVHPLHIDQLSSTMAKRLK